MYPPSPPALLAAVAAVIVVYGVYRLLQVGKRPSDLPPGPPTLPILGNLHQVSSQEQHSGCSRVTMNRQRSRPIDPIFNSKNGLKNMGKDWLIQVLD